MASDCLVEGNAVAIDYIPVRSVYLSGDSIAGNDLQHNDGAVLGVTYSVDLVTAGGFRKPEAMFSAWFRASSCHQFVRCLRGMCLCGFVVPPEG